MKKIAVLIIALLGLCSVLFVGAAPASAAETQETAETQEETSITDNFLSVLKEKYGEEWEAHYNAILDKWGSVEAFLMSVVPEDAPDPVKNGWEAFVSWTREYWVILAFAGATVCVCAGGVIYHVSKKRIKNFVKTANDEKFSAVYNEQNKQSAFLIAQGKATLALLGENPRFAQQKEEVQKRMEDLQK